MSQPYDLVVVGGGSGGVRAARMAASYGARVAVVEEYRYGGTCVIRGCVPKKLFVYASRFRDDFEIAESFGWQVDARFDWKTLKANKDREIARLESVYVSVLERNNVDVIRDRALIEGEHKVRLLNADRVLDARHILVATGGHPFIPNIPGAEFGISSNEAFELDELPKSVLIEGAGYVAVEFATIFAGLGVETTISYRRDHILRKFDSDLGAGLEDAMQLRGVTFRFNTIISHLERSASGVKVSFGAGEAKDYGAVMFATGRLPNTRHLGLEKAGVDMSDNGIIKVDAFSQTTVPSIYAVGDVTGRAELTPVAIREGAAFAETVFNDNPTAVDHSLIPTAVFSEPELGTVGLSEDAAAKTGDIDVYVARFRPMVATLGDREDKMLLKLITEKDGGKVLGCHIMGHGAAEMVQLIAIPMGMGASKADLDRTIALHPSASEELVTFKAPSYVYRAGQKSA